MTEYRTSHYRTPRNMNEAFGPYAELEVDKDPLAIRIFNFIASIFR